MEMKLDTGIDRTLNCMTGKMKQVYGLQNKGKQKMKTIVLIQYSNACIKACTYVRKTKRRSNIAWMGRMWIQFWQNLEYVFLDLFMSIFNNIPIVVFMACYQFMIAERRKCIDHVEIPMIHSFLKPYMYFATFLKLKSAHENNVLIWTRTLFTPAYKFVQTIDLAACFTLQVRLKEACYT